MKRTLVFAVPPLVGVGMLLLVTAAAAQRYVVPGRMVAIYNLAGEVVIDAGSGDRTVVEVARGGDDAGELRIMDGVIGGRQTLRVVYPANRIVYPELGRGSSTNLHVRRDGTFGGANSAWNGRRVTIAGSGGGLEAHANLHIAVPEGADVIVRHAAGDVHVSNVNAKLFVDVATSEITARGTRGSLSIDTGSGSVRVSDAEGEVHIDTGSGEVEVTDMSGESLLIDTGSGSVRANKIETPRFSVDTGSGEVELSDVRSRSVSIDTGSGSVNVDLLTDIESLSIDTGSGDATVSLPADAGAMLALETGSGDVDVTASLTRVHRSDGELRGQLGDGRGTITIETGSGTIRIDNRR